MAISVQIVDPRSCPHWNEEVLSHDTCSVFHSSQWAAVLSEAYHYRPVYMILRSENERALFPLMEVDSWVTGKRAVSLPFTDYCDPVPAGLPWDECMDRLSRFGKDAGWKYIEFRSSASLPAGSTPSSRYRGHLLDLRRSEEELFRNLRDTTRRNIRKAEKSGVVVETGSSGAFLNEFYRLNCLTRREHGLPPQPYTFFTKLHEHLISQDLGMIVLASYRNKKIAGGLFLHSHGKAMFKYGASDKRYQDLRPNNLVMWEAIRTYRSRGYQVFSFGRTEEENRGLLQFKAGWGATEFPIYYYKYDLQRNAFVKDTIRLKGAHNYVFARMPQPLLKLVGALLYRHMG